MPGGSISPPWAGHGQKARDWQGLALPGGQEAGAGLSRAPAPLVPASPCRIQYSVSVRARQRRFQGPCPGCIFPPPPGLSNTLYHHVCLFFRMHAPT